MKSSNADRKKAETIEEKLYKKLLAHCSETFEVKKDDYFKTTSGNQYFDFVIYKDEFPFAIIEHKTNIYRAIDNGSSKRKFISMTKEINARYCVITDNKNFYLYDRYEHLEQFVRTSCKELVEKINNPKDKIVTETEKEQIVEIFKNAVSGNLCDEFINNPALKENIVFDNMNRVFCFKSHSGLESIFFEKLMNQYNFKPIYKYTSLRALFSILNKKSFRMSGIAGMNDKSEIDYVESYLGFADSSTDRHSTSRISEINRCFIMAGVDETKFDDLTLWRLYGDDCKGACLEFEIDSHNIDDSFKVKRVDYADKRGQHKKLDILKEIIYEVDNQFGFKFKFKKLWAHISFFKPFDYADENEIRVLYMLNDSNDKNEDIKLEWVSTFSHSIFIPTVNFNLMCENFPLKLKRIIIGPNCPEQKTNLFQIREMLKQIGLSDHIKVILSEIDSYR